MQVALSWVKKSRVFVINATFMATLYAIIVYKLKKNIWRVLHSESWLIIFAIFIQNLKHLHFAFQKLKVAYSREGSLYLQILYLQIQLSMDWIINRLSYQWIHRAQIICPFRRVGGRYSPISALSGNWEVFQMELPWMGGGRQTWISWNWNVCKVGVQYFWVC